MLQPSVSWKAIRYSTVNYYSQSECSNLKELVATYNIILNYDLMQETKTNKI